jgi:amino acid efflux transporter
VAQAADQLAKTLALSGAVALALGICLGAGLLVLTGLAYQESGAAAIYAWLIDGFMISPVLAILAYLGAKDPNAEGVAGIARAAFGKHAAVAVQALLIGTFSLSLPGIAIVGGNYFAVLIGGSRELGLMAAAAILIFAGLSNYSGVQLSGTIQRIITFGLLSIVTLVATLALLFGDYSAGSGVAAIAEWSSALPSMNLIFLAFTGWILVASIGEEYKNPARDYPLTIGISFAVVLGLYVAIALATQLTLSRGDPRLVTAPVAAILSALFGEISGKAVAFMGVLIVTANLNGATWAVSRLLMASARTGLLPHRLAAVNAKFQVPGNAIIVTTILFLLVLSIYALNLVSLSSLFLLAGQNFLLLYLLCVACFIKQAPARRLRWAASLLFLLYLFWASSYGLTLLYPLLLMSAGIAALTLNGERSLHT